MPTYEYECKHCNYKFEVFQKITDGPIQDCPKCKNKIRRLIGSGSGIIFRGSGFYATDYRKKPKTDDTAKAKAKTKAVDSNTCPQTKDGCNACKPE